jgi:hypothetical protein
MTGAPPGGAGMSRRGLLALAALAAVPLAACNRRSDFTDTGPPGGPSSAPGSSGGPSASSAGPSGSSRTAAKGSQASDGGPVKRVPGKVLLGSYLDLKNKTLPQALALRRQQLGRDQAIVHMFYNWTDTLLSPVPPVGDSTLLVSWAGTTWAQITGGSSDKLIASAAKRLAAYDKPLLLRWGWEMNGNWFAWDGTHNGKKTAGYAKCWQRMRKIFKDEGADKVSWVWSPNWNSGPDVSWNQYEHYYPGDDYVDWVGVSAYPFNKQTPTTLFHRICDEYGARKPIMLTETASIDNGGTTKRDWINACAAYLKAQPAIGGVVWFDTDVQPGTKENFRVDSGSSVLAAYKAMATSTRLTTTG